mmetsp:Transcript_2674/g.8926  ORF Transcript_2674/g.8926 Transcript_2674/m.8926 type:complete len:200 (+) Transcript_2674:3735-4334(+)
MNLASGPAQCSWAIASSRLGLGEPMSPSSPSKKKLSLPYDRSGIDSDTNLACSSAPVAADAAARSQMPRVSTFANRESRSPCLELSNSSMTSPFCPSERSLHVSPSLRKKTSCVRRALSESSSSPKSRCSTRGAMITLASPSGTSCRDETHALGCQCSTSFSPTSFASSSARALASSIMPLAFSNSSRRDVCDDIRRSA